MDKKDNIGVQIVLGVAAPASILAIFAYNLASGWVYVPSSKRRVIRFIWTDDEALVWLWIMIKLACVVGMVSWFLLANHKRTEHLAMPGIILAIAMMIIGVTAALVLA